MLHRVHYSSLKALAPRTSLTLWSLFLVLEKELCSFIHGVSWGCSQDPDPRLLLALPIMLPVLAKDPHFISTHQDPGESLGSYPSPQHWASHGLAIRGIPFRTTYQGAAPFTMSWALQHHLLINKMSPMGTHISQSNGDNPSIEVSGF